MLAERRLPWLLLSVLLASCGPDESQIGGAQAPILGGSAETVGAYPTVVAVVANQSLCTGTLVGADLVLTAAHCISPAVLGYVTQEQVTANTTVILDTANIYEAGGTQLAVADTTPHPAFDMNALGDNDIGLIRLSSEITDREPSPINRIHDDALPGTSLTQVGFGRTDAGDAGSAGQLHTLEDKSAVSCNPFRLSNNNLLCYSQTDGTGKCNGDSGGPSFATIGGFQRVVGVATAGSKDCADFGVDTRPDAELDFLFQHAPKLQCQADGACNDACGASRLPLDPDCPRCESDGECGADEVCHAGRCVPPPFSPGGLGSTCETDADCASGLCARDAEGGQCSDWCIPDGNDCPSGFDCLSAGSDDVCWPGEGGGGCSVGRDAGTDLRWLPLALLLLIGLLRRRTAPNKRRV